MDFDFSSVTDGVSSVTALLALGVCVIFYLYIQWANSPPGPTGLPILGYYPFLRNDYYVQLHEMVKKYGEVFCFKCTGQLYVYLGNSRFVREAHVTKSDCFAVRTSNFSLLKDLFGSGLAYENGETWKELRRFFTRRLKEFGLGKETQENTMGHYLQKTVATLKEKEKLGENFDAMMYFGETCSEAIYTLFLNGTKTNAEDIKTFNEAYYVVNEVLLNSSALLTGPLLQYVFMYLKSDLRKYRQCKNYLEDVLAKIIKDHEKEFDGNNIRDLVDCFIKERKDMAEKGDPKSKIFTDKALIGSLIQIVGDGGSSVGGLVAAVIKELVSRPDIQKKIQQEIDEIVGPSRLPSWDDRSRAPYTNAAISECFRLCGVFPALPSLESIKETTIGGCRVPKGTITLVSFWSMFHDPEVYKDPEKFDPSRFFLNEEKKSKSEIPLLFGAGRRSCIGETLVNMETFLFVTTILQNFDLHEVKEEKTSGEFSAVFRATSRKS